MRRLRRWGRLGSLAVPRLAAQGRGFFIPHRLAGRVRPPSGYPAIEPCFAGTTAEFRRQLTGAARYLPQFLGFGGAPPAPRFEQDWFPRLDAALAYTLVRERKPRRIVEIGSGHSTRVMARAVADGGGGGQLVSVDPEPRARLDGLAVEWIRRPIQEVAEGMLGDFTATDILFVDSSHALAPGSDVDCILAMLLPRIPPGGAVHFHDIFLPDAYPESWSWRGYNEQNALVPLIAGGGWRLLWSSHWVATRMVRDVAASGLGRLPLMAGAFESSLWLEKL
ncbi:MAG TPA: class I SAM-dependent methyltransferase [Alphaproteobacteria bacterium]